MAKTTILVDERKDNSPFIVCHEERGQHSVLESGCISDPDELRSLQIKHDADVQIDCAFMGTRLEAAARHYKWRLLKFRNGDYPFIESLIQEAS